MGQIMSPRHQRYYRHQSISCIRGQIMFCGPSLPVATSTPACGEMSGRGTDIDSRCYSLLRSCYVPICAHLVYIRGPSRTYVTPILWNYVLGIYIACGARAYAFARAPGKKTLEDHCATGIQS